MVWAKNLRGRPQVRGTIYENGNNYTKKTKFLQKEKLQKWDFLNGKRITAYIPGLGHNLQKIFPNID